MALGAHTMAPRRVLEGGQAEWSEALGVVPGVGVFPHFDRMRAWRPGVLEAAGAAAAADLILLGIDEDTALVSPGGGPAPAAGRRWHVMGRQGVTVYRAGAQERVYRAGAEVAL